MRQPGKAYPGMTPPRTDLPEVGTEIAAAHCDRFWYIGMPFTVVAVDPARPRITLHGTRICEVGGLLESDEVYDGGCPPGDTRPYAVLRWNLLAALTDAEREPIERHRREVAEVRAGTRLTGSMDPKVKHQRDCADGYKGKGAL